MLKILEKTDELVNLIIESDEYKKYQNIKDKMEKDEEIMTLINEVKILQKEAVKKSSKNESTKDIDIFISDKFNILNNFPIDQEYLEVEEEINTVLQTIKNTIENYINKAIQ